MPASLRRVAGRGRRLSSRWRPAAGHGRGPAVRRHSTRPSDRLIPRAASLGAGRVPGYPRVPSSSLMAELEIDSQRATPALTRADAPASLAPAGEERRTAPPRAEWIRVVWPVAFAALGATAFLALSTGARHIRDPVSLVSHL